MRYIIDIPDGLHQKIARLVAGGKYSTIQDFAFAALQNQLLLEKSYQDANSSQVLYLYDPQVKFKVDKEVLHQLELIEESRINSVPYKMDGDETGWIFGQINRILPVKYGLRVLMNLLQEEGEWVPLDFFHDKASHEARKFGNYLKNQDDLKNRSRSERFSVGFPIGEFSKSSDRYKTQFLGYVQPSSGLTIGALPNLLFSVISFREGQDFVGITEAGKEFGILPNPALDSSSDEGGTFSKEETQYFINHINRHVKREADAQKTMLKLIDSGCDETGCIDRELSRKFPQWSKPQVATNRSGVIGRMRELNLSRREYKGSAIQYPLTALGRKALVVLTS